MITNQTLDFLSGLKENNNREWFLLHHSEYEAAKEEFLDTVVGLLNSISEFDPVIARSHLAPESCIMRIFRDVRFSRDKTPYKPGFFAFICKDGRKSPNAGYYLHVEPGASFAGGGLYMPEPKVLEKTRSAINLHFDEWLSIVNEKKLLGQFAEGVKPSGATKRPPKGYDDSNPAIEYLKYKGYYTQRFFTDKEVSSPGFVASLSDSFKVVMPMVGFLNNSINGL
jgi:uncharacterized protein (TIGR02453 family)